MMIGKYGGKIQESWNIQNTSPKSKRPSIIFSYEKKICMITSKDYPPCGHTISKRLVSKTLDKLVLFKIKVVTIVTYSLRFRAMNIGIYSNKITTFCTQMPRHGMISREIKGE